MNKKTSKNKMKQNHASGTPFFKMIAQGKVCYSTLLCAVFIFCTFASGFVFTGCQSKKNSSSGANVTSSDASMTDAMTTPYGRYPEEQTYTLGKMIGANNSNMPEGDTYENNEYTRYLKKMLNIQNKDAFEGYEAGGDYDRLAKMHIKFGDIPDIMVVSDLDTVEQLYNAGMIEDLTTAYNNCATKTIKDIYNSYGSDVLENVTFDGKIMAIPETNIDAGPSMLWLRKDWMDELKLGEPKTMDDALEIVRQFVAKDKGYKQGDTDHTVGLVTVTDLVGDAGYSYEYTLDVLFANYGAYPKQWIEDATTGDAVYGSVQPEAKEALGKIRQLYKEGILDSNFLLRTQNNIVDLIKSGKCGSFFGPWWAPNNPLMDAVKEDPNANWQPYLISTGEDGAVSYASRNPVGKYVVVRKGYAHPEIAVKIISVLFDYARYEANDAEGIAEYFSLNVDPTARPLSINVDYNDALLRCYNDISKVMAGEKDEKELQILESAYYKTCKEYLAAENPSPEQWAAYASRITACKLLKEKELNRVDSLFFGETETMKTTWSRLTEEENKVYLKIVTGQEPLDSFDSFVNNWKTSGGERITREVREKIKTK